MSTFVKGQLTEICPGKLRADYTTYAAYDGATAEVLGLYGFGVSGGIGEMLLAFYQSDW